ncbi:XRE family transcriptional regulator [Herbaspirillum rubrisubalbicans]|jgi:two-component system response regulator QseB|uniref:DNA-binding response regulator n=2 Tax=Herbaspirillum rubrisubalbicans TaxID=80842 RepID=A0AAD0UCP0_9BURK|nr:MULTISPECIES: response regulator [Herbaspirillum]ALU91480.1 two component response regulator [Herbaspirillum rubrisubalbicans M1]AYR26501.1 DNA-binding response regulator [Herbaspirillum rubrisubalbicans]MCP1574914.1 two-component system response regulator QseB [Herbaspirillum rubrisubalbicans]NQE51257.1 XRE family transcriptional regulator [Herbaspirillum rubrisubalbicans]QJQ03397.1 DNA-binding response regulator [Herbaspirillum rubrisubalbicans Os34]
MRVLLVEDDPMVGEAVRKGLRQDGFTIDWVQDGKSADVALRTEDYAMLLLDLGLPQKDGLAVLRTLRERGNTIPVLITTARDAVADRVAGLDAGADDYLIKPFDLEELSARMRALSRRQAGRAESLVQVREVVLNPATHEVTVGGNPVNLSAREFALLQAFMDRPGVVLSRAQLEEKLYGWDDSIESNAVEVHIHALRKKVGSDFIKNVRGVGYLVPA